MQTLKFVLTGQMPSGKNRILFTFRHGRMMKYPEPRFKAWRAKAWPEIHNQRGTWRTLRQPARVYVSYWPGDLIRRDVPGIMDALCHLLEYHPAGLEALKVIEDDSLLVSWNWTRMPLDRANPRIEVEIQPLPEDA